eukprot:TRINITY_DN9757_c0_g1_i1.p1 TRINITY_DN9757_c0_g1~~TRINITY_DN9757_c0_g1_i1.p1  ORF type:complete len:278 (-),score=74.69 TRINITY_DN9757_c0_g1_i1:493-1209(-)
MLRSLVGSEMCIRDSRYTEESEGVIRSGPDRGKHVVRQPGRHLQATEAVGEAARKRFSVSGKVHGVMDIVDSNRTLAHYLHTTETMRVHPAVTPAELNKAVSTMYPNPPDGASLAHERIMAENLMEMRKRVAKPEMSLACSRRVLPAISSKTYQQVLEMCKDCGQLLCVSVFGAWVTESTRMEKAAEEVNATLWQRLGLPHSSPSPSPSPSRTPSSVVSVEATGYCSICVEVRALLDV